MTRKTRRFLRCRRPSQHVTTFTRAVKSVAHHSPRRFLHFALAPDNMTISSSLLVTDSAGTFGSGSGVGRDAVLDILAALSGSRAADAARDLSSNLSQSAALRALQDSALLVDSTFHRSTNGARPPPNERG